jgi:GT2 family glycosyltransferase
VKDASALIITVNFRQDKCTRRFLNSAAALEDFPRCHLSIVDNNSSDDSLPSLRSASAEFANVELLASPRNAGYFSAAGWALQRYLENHDAPDWVVICNNDVVFDDPRFLSQLLARDPNTAGVIAPAITSGLTGYDENPSIARRPSQLRMLRYSLWLSNYYLMWFKQWLSPSIRKIRNRLRAWAAASANHKAIYAPSGALLIFSRCFFESGGFIDDGSFLYAEEFRVAEMCRQLRLPIIHDPALRVWHEGSQSTGRLLTRDVFQHQKNGFRYAFGRYNSSYPELGTTPQPVTTHLSQIEPKVQPSPAGDRIP